MLLVDKRRTLSAPQMERRNIASVKHEVKRQVNTSIVRHRMQDAV